MNRTTDFSYHVTKYLGEYLPCVRNFSVNTIRSYRDVVTIRMWGGVPAESGPQAACDAFNEAYKDKGMWVCGFFAMAIKYCETVLAVEYREPRPVGEGYIAGPAMILRNGLGCKKFLPAFMIVAGLITSSCFELFIAAQFLGIWRRLAFRAL